MMGSRRGVFLVEAMVALAVVLVLAGFLAPAIRAGRMRGRAARVVAAARTVGSAIATYHQYRQSWPASAGSGLTPAGLATFTSGTAFQGNDYVLRYTLRSVTTRGGELLHPILVVSPTDPAACPDVYAGLGGARNPSIFAYCGNDSGSVYLFIN
ncbi:MAG: hypothetical protein ACREL2_06310 [Gemmatimonadales bacterium]